MRVAIFHNLPSGGAKRALWGTAKYLSRAGCSIDVFVPSTANEDFLPLQQFANGVCVQPLHTTALGLAKSMAKYLFPRGCLSLADLDESHKRLADIINNGEYDVVFVEQDRYTMSPFILKYLSLPHVYYCQQPRRSNEAILKILGERIETNSFERAWTRYCVPRLDAIDKENASHARMILSNSCFSSEAILRAYGKNSFVSYLGVDRELFKPLKLEKEQYVLSVGSIVAEKGFDFIIRALGLVDRTIRPRLIIVGNTVKPAYRDYLVRLAAEKGVNLETKVLIDDSELVSLYNKAKLCVYAPFLEPFGLVPVEAMACGTPVVAVREGGVRESVVHKESGLLTNRDEKEFAGAITELLLNNEMYQYMSGRAVDIVSGFWTCEKAAQRLIKHMRHSMKMQ
ncbi:MAG: glycosyltransferase family 4 protein [Methanothrix sp.]|nr:glycosyltransferase family 4 protein [Methanothrix sp.]